MMIADRYFFSSFLLMCGSVCASAADKSSTPNVVLIYADDIGFGDLSCNGASTVRTPNVERLARGGINFTNAHSAAATSTPSRYAMLTGEYAWRRNGTGIADGDAGMIIRPDRFTLADLFKNAGYATGMVGKWHLGLGEKNGEQNWNEKLVPGIGDLGFDYSFAMAATGDRVPCVFVENGNVVNLDPADPIEVSYQHNFPGEPTGRDNPELLRMLPSHGHDMSIVNGISRIGYMKGGKSALWKDEEIALTLVDKAVSFMEEQKDRPFFLYLATQDAHVPRVPNERFAGKSGMGSRGDCLLEFDWTVGEIMKALERLGLDGNTLIIVSSDNGPVVDDGYQDQAVELLGGHKPGGIYRGGKYSLYEAGTRVPCVWNWKNHIAPGQVSDALVCQIDWIASLAALLGESLPEKATPDGCNQLDTWLGKNRTDRGNLVLQNGANNLTLIKDGWKYIRPGGGAAYIKEVGIETGNSKNPQLYNLRKDPSEQYDVASGHPEILKEMQESLEAIVDGRFGLSMEE